MLRVSCDDLIHCYHLRCHCAMPECRSPPHHHGHVTLCLSPGKCWSCCILAVGLLDDKPWSSDGGEERVQPDLRDGDVRDSPHWRTCEHPCFWWELVKGTYHLIFTMRPGIKDTVRARAHIGECRRILQGYVHQSLTHLSEATLVLIWGSVTHRGISQWLTFAFRSPQICERGVEGNIRFLWINVFQLIFSFSP